MADFISRQDAIDKLTKWADGYRYIEVETEYAVNEFGAIPSADVEPVRHGRWMEENPLDAPNCRLIKCSECGKSFIVSMSVLYEDWIDGRNFCYSCGARMGGGEQDGT